VVLDVPGAALLVGDEGVDRALALELSEDRRIRASDGVRQDVEPPTVGDADQHLVRTSGGRELDGLVEHRHEDVETLDRELLLADESPSQVGLEALDLSQASQQPAAFLRSELAPEASRLDGLP
jgi:hypothetical protein